MFDLKITIRNFSGRDVNILADTNRLVDSKSSVVGRHKICVDDVFKVFTHTFDI